MVFMYGQLFGISQRGGRCSKGKSISMIIKKNWSIDKRDIIYKIFDEGIEAFIGNKCARLLDDGDTILLRFQTWAGNLPKQLRKFRRVRSLL